MATKWEMTKASVWTSEERNGAIILVVTQSRKPKDSDKWEKKYYRALCLQEAREQAPLLARYTKCTLTGWFDQNDWQDKHGQKRKDISLICNSISDIEPSNWVAPDDKAILTDEEYTTDDIPF